MIEKKISYNINIEKPSTTKPVKQGGVLNYLGKQKTVNAPVKWRSSKDHPIAHLAYITKDEEKILVDLDLYNSLKGKPNKGPSGIMSLNGGGGGGDGGGSSGGDGSSGDGSSGDGSSGDGDSSGDSSGEGDSGPGGSDDGSGHGGPGQGDSGPGGSDDGTGHGGPGPGVGSEGGFGIGPDAAQEAAQSAAQSISADDVSAQAQADQEDAATAAAAAAAESPGRGVMDTISNFARTAYNVYSNISPVSLAMNAISNMSRGVTAPDDFSQATTSVQSGPAQSPTEGGGITTINQFAPLYNPTTGDNTADAMRARLNALLDIKPTVYGIPAASQLSNYNLLDLVNIRR
jgi:hypothetical protein